MTKTGISFTFQPASGDQGSDETHATLPGSTEDVQDTAEESKESVKEPSAKEKAATKIVKEIDDEARYDESNQLKTLIVMQILGNTKSFFDTQATIQDKNVDEYLSKSIEDQYGLLFQLAQDVTMEDMINAQY